MGKLRPNLRSFIVKGKRLIWTKQEERGCLFYLLASERRWLARGREGSGGNCVGGYAEAVGTLGGCAEAVETLWEGMKGLWRL